MSDGIDKEKSDESFEKAWEDQVKSTITKFTRTKYNSLMLKVIISLINKRILKSGFVTN